MDEFKDGQGMGERPEPNAGQDVEDSRQDNRRTVFMEETRRRPAAQGMTGMQQGIPPKKKSGMKIFLIILGLCLLLAVVSLVSCDGDDDYGYSADGPYIGTLYVEGTIQSGNVDSFGLAYGYQHQWTLSQIDYMMYDTDNRGLIIFVDSPGGTVYDSDELYMKIKEYQKVTGNPVYAYMGSMAASGGYYISAPADRIYANRNAWTGSIGVTIGTVYDFSGFLERFGIRTETITSGVNKAMGSSVDPMTDQQRAIWQSLVDEAYEQFAGIVAEGRNMPIERVREIADGRIYSANQALELGLVDAVGTFDHAAKDMKMRYKLRDCEVVDIVYQNNSFWSSILSGIAHAGQMQGSSEAAAVLSLIKPENQMPVSYMCQWLNN